MDIRNLSCLIIGYGAMGKAYRKNLRDIGVGNIAVYDTKATALEQCKKDDSSCVICNNFSEMFFARPDVVFILANTPKHLTLIKASFAFGWKNIFVEKPLVMAEQISNVPLLPKDCKVAVGYLIPFSGAVLELQAFIYAYDLRIAEMRVLWTKNRVPNKEKRSTAGDLEDECTHGVHLALALAEGLNYGVSLSVVGNCSYVPYMDCDVQKSAHKEDPSFPLEPTSTTQAHLLVGENPAIPCFVTSSFIGAKQERRVEVSLTREGKLFAVALLRFDEKRDDKLEDHLDVFQYSGEPLVKGSFSAGIKLKEQIEKYLSWVAGQEKDFRLTDWNGGLCMVNLAGAILESANQFKARHEKRT